MHGERHLVPVRDHHPQSVLEGRALALLSLTSDGRTEAGLNCALARRGGNGAEDLNVRLAHSVCLVCCIGGRFNVAELQTCRRAVRVRVVS